MQIHGTIHCLFEQSGTFKKEFQKLGYNAFDYDIENQYNQTDFVVDLFSQIEAAWRNKPSLFDKITPEDLVLAFFPCIYFSQMSQILHTWGAYPDKPYRERSEAIINRSRMRQTFYELLIKLITVCKERKIRMILENPAHGSTYLSTFFITPPTIIDRNRAIRGDYFVKPTAYWFINCEPINNITLQPNPHPKRIKKDCNPSKTAGHCSMERSTISPDYARNFICDYILGKPQLYTIQDLFQN